MLFTFSANHKNYYKKTITSLLLITLLTTPLLILNSQPANAAETVLTAKWSRSSMGTNWEGGLVIGDVTGDGSEDIVYAGGGSDRINVLNGATGTTIATYTNSRISQYCQPQLYDVDGDGILDIVVPLYSRPGLAVVQYDGDSTLSALWVRDTQGTSGSGSCMSKPVAGDIDGDGHPEIYIACQDVSPAYNQNSQTGLPIPDGYDGTVTMFDYQGNIVAQNFNWRSCSGGLSLADTDNDGEFELYMGDRDMYYGDGNYGKGTIAYWARNMSIIWQRLDFLSSSQAPVLVDVNGDGILDVLAGMYGNRDGMSILNSTNGALMQRWLHSDMSVHYGFTVYDIDGDGHQELLCCDGDHDDDPYADVFDLVTGQLEAELNLAGGDTKWSPIVADISPTQPGMEIIVVPNGTTLETGYWRGAIMIFNSNFESVQNISRFNGNTIGSQLAYPMIQDIDGDGLLELVTHSSSGTIYAFDTQAPEPEQRIRSEVTYYGEKRNGVAQYEIPPWGPNYWTAPVVAPAWPANDALNVTITATQLSFNMREHQGQNVNYTVTTSPDIGTTFGSSIGNSYNWRTYTVNINPGSLNYDTTYKWTVTATDGTYTTTKTYTFHTELAPAPAGNSAPTQDNPILTPTDGVGTTASNFVAVNQSTTDANGNAVTNIYRWLVNGVPSANLQLPFDLRSATSTKDYAYGNNGIVQGATWVPNGIVGGAYSFDGQNDAIIISDGGKGYFDNKTYADNQPELGGGGTWTELTVEAWINLEEYNTGSRIVAKVPSYELGFRSGSTNTLMASVWPKTGEINYNDDNHASSDDAETVTASVDLQLNTWYHVAFTYKSGEGLKLYLNGQLVGERTGVSGPLEESFGEPVYIGRLVEPFNGLIDEVAIYPYAQPAQQIANSYQNMASGSSSSASFIPIGIGSPGDTLTCQVIPTDAYVEGTTRSASAVLLNSPPTAFDLMFYPLRDRNYRLDVESLTAAYQYADLDGDIESGTQIRWYLNGILQTQYNDVLTIPATIAGQNWYFTVLPRDASGTVGTLTTSATVIIRSNTAPITYTPLLTSGSGNLVATAQGTYDANGDETTNIYHWFKNGVSQTNLQMPFDTETQTIISTNLRTLDNSGYNNHGTVYGAYWIQDAVVGGGLTFDGNDYIRVQEQGNSLGGDGSWSELSVEYWVKASGITSAESVVIKHDTSYSTSSSSSYGIGYRSDFRSYANRDRFYWYIYNSTGLASVEYSDYTNFGLWHHVVCTYKSGVGLQLYVDGALRATTPFTGNINATLDGILDIGGLGGSSDFSGMLDEVRIYPTALSEGQVLQRYTETKDGLSSSNTIVAQETTVGEVWRCQVIPNDSWQDGGAANSQTIVIGPSTQYTLTIEPSTNGNTNPTAGTYNYSEYNQAVIQAIQNSGYQLSYWLRNGTNVGNANPYYLTMDANYNLSAVFIEALQYTLHVQVDGLGSTNSTGDNLYNAGTLVSVQATPSAGWEFSHWLLNNTNVADTSIYTLTMDNNYNLTALFVEQTTPPEYTLTVNTVGDGSVTKNPTQVTYTEGTNVTLTATPTSGASFIGWSGDASGTEPVITIQMTNDKTVTAEFTTIPPQETPVFEDDFESGSFSAWTSTTRTTGENTTIVSNIVHGGSNSALFTTSGDGTYERAYASRSGLNLGELYAKAYIYVDSSGIADNSDRFYFIQLMAGGNILAYAGWRQDTSGNLHWHIMVRDGTNTVGAYSTVTPATDNWYLVELHWKADATAGLGELFVNDDLVASITDRNTANYGNATITRVGLPEVYNCAATTVYIDDVAVSTTQDTEPQEPEIVYLIIEDSEHGTTNPPKGGYPYPKNTVVSVYATPSPGYVLNGWVVDGITMPNTNPYQITMDTLHGIAPLFIEETPEIYYQLTVLTTGTGTTSITGTSQYPSGSNIVVQATPIEENWQFDHWLLNGTDVGSTNPYIVTMNGNYSLTAVFIEQSPQTEFTLTVNIIGDGAVIRIPNQTTYTNGTNVTLTAIPNSDASFIGWIGDASSTELSITIQMTSDKTLTAEFTTTQQPPIFEDDFETGDISLWTTSSATSNEGISIVVNPVYEGNYSAGFDSSGDGGYEKAYVTKTLPVSLGEVYVQCAFRLTQNGLVENGDRIKLIEIRSGNTIVAAAGLAVRSGTLRLWLETRDGTSYVETYVQSSVDFSSWFTLELQWVNSASNGGGTLWVNGLQAIQVAGDNTSNYGNPTDVRVGLSEVYNCGTTVLTVDDVIIDDQYIT
ncbi:MAG: LamG-like jellyroll fold domain-containing protein [Candidatus Bathyarchaeia archaeon]|jgi:hypothetical protein